jgi:hypothetical protein
MVIHQRVYSEASYPERVQIATSKYENRLKALTVSNLGLLKEKKENTTYLRVLTLSKACFAKPPQTRSTRILALKGLEAIIGSFIRGDMN